MIGDVPQPASRMMTKLIVALSTAALLACGSSDSGSEPSGSGGTGSGSGGSASGGSNGTGGRNGTGGAPSGTGGASAASCDALNQVFIPKCAACHVHNGIAPDDFSTEQALSALVGGIQMFPCRADQTSSIVNAAAPLGGSLFLWISGSSCLEQMPQGMTPLTAADIACVKSYFMAKIKP
jgi:hypothetical protein